MSVYVVFFFGGGGGGGGWVAGQLHGEEYFKSYQRTSVFLYVIYIDPLHLIKNPYIASSYVDTVWLYALNLFSIARVSLTPAIQRILHQGLVVIMDYLRTYFITLLELPMTNLQRR